MQLPRELAPDAVSVLLEETRAVLGPPPRKESRLPEPPPLPPGDAFSRQFAAQLELQREGTAVWAVILKANKVLREDGVEPSGVLIAHARDPATPFDPAAIGRVQAFAASKARDDQDFASILRRDQARAFSLAAPRSVGLDVFVSTLLVQRELLPVPRLTSPLLPVLVHPRRREVALVPAQRWSPKLVSAWRGEPW